MKAGLFGIAMAVACAQGASAQSATDAVRYDAIVAKHASANGVPERLVRRVIMRESRYNPRAFNRGHYGMMQIKHATAKAMGYQGVPSGLFDADTNLAYAVRYLAGAYKVAGGDEDRAVRFYASGYYYDAKRRGMLAAVGLGRGAAFPPATQVAAAAPVPPGPVAKVEARVASTPTAAPQGPRVIGANPQPVLASVAPVSPTTPVRAVAPAANAASTAANARVASAVDAVGGMSRVAAVAPTPEAQAFASSRALGAPAELVEMAAPRAPVVPVPLPPVAARPAVAAIVAKPATPVPAIAAAPTQTAAFGPVMSVPTPPMRDPAVVTSAIERPAPVAPRAQPRRFGPPK